MKSAAWGIVLAILATATAVGAAEPEGFGDLRWGDPAPRGWELTRRGESQICSKRPRPKTFGSARLERVEYEFVRGGLVGVALFTRERSDFSALKGELDTRFGASGAQAPLVPAATGLRWKGLVTGAELYDLGPGAPAVLFLTSAGALVVSGGLGEPAEERALQNQVCLYAHLVKAVDSQIAAETQRALNAASVEATSQHLGQGCRGWSAPNEDRDLMESEAGSAPSKGQILASLRERLQKEKGQLEAQLSSLRSAPAASVPSAPTP